MVTSNPETGLAVAVKVTDPFGSETASEESSNVTTDGSLMSVMVS
jgi:hypothetical protein